MLEVILLNIGEKRDRGCAGSHTKVIEIVIYLRVKRTGMEGAGGGGDGVLCAYRWVNRGKRVGRVGRRSGSRAKREL